MASFVVKIGKKQLDTDATEIAIGTRSACTISIDDPIAADLHAWIRLAAGGFTIEDAGSSTGTWRNGLPVDTPQVLASGDVLVVGCTKLKATVSEADGKPSLALVVEERGFYFEISRKRKDAGKWIVGGDAENWVRSEVAFGRFRPVSVGNWAAAGLALVLLLLCALPFWRTQTLQPGSLHASHAALFTRDPSEIGDVELAGLIAGAQDEGCGACHDTFGGTPLSKCAACHADVMKTRHPFPADRNKAGAMEAFELDASLCSDCHLDHQGADPAPGVFVYTPEQSTTTCTRCHAGGALPPPLRRPVPGSLAERTVAIDYDFFPHDKHAQDAQGGKIACGLCHVAQEQEPDLRADRVRRDFPPVRFETCMGCHSAFEQPGGRSPLANSWVRKADWKQYWAPQEKRARLAWHGARGGENETRCLACHAKVHAKPQRTVVTRAAAQLAFDVVRRDHADLFAGHVQVTDASGRSRACIECHVDGRLLSAGEPKTGRLFWHALHLASIAAPRDDASAVARSAKCRECHTEQLGAKQLVGSPDAGEQDLPADGYRGPPSSSDAALCAECHQDGSANPLSIRPGEPVLAPVSDAVVEALRARNITRNDFPHDLHLRERVRSAAPDGTLDPLAADCFACHAFEGHGGAFDASPTTQEDARNCLGCHASHENVGGDGCQLCHPQTDKVYSSATYSRSWPEKNAFEHGSPGHRKLFEEGSCEECHRGVETASKVSDVPIPDETDESCWNCHVVDRQQFHWRGSITR